jgi:hypothetical protein
VELPTPRVRRIRLETSSSGSVMLPVRVEGERVVAVEPVPAGARIVRAWLVFELFGEEHEIDIFDGRTPTLVPGDVITCGLPVLSD